VLRRGLVREWNRITLYRAYTKLSTGGPEQRIHRNTQAPAFHRSVSSSSSPFPPFSAPHLSPDKKTEGNRIFSSNLSTEPNLPSPERGQIDEKSYRLHAPVRRQVRTYYQPLCCDQCLPVRVLSSLWGEAWANFAPKTILPCFGFRVRLWYGSVPAALQSRGAGRYGSLPRMRN
jgi:hypothetical protein